MEKSLVKKRGPAAIFALCPAAHVIALLGAGVVALFFALRHDTEKMRFLSLQLVQPLHRVLARLTARLPFSLAEWLYAAVIGGTLLYIAAELVLLIRRPARLQRLYRLLMRLAALGLGVYTLFCVLWGVYYYGDDFIARSGLELHDISAGELELTTLYFADLLNEYAPGCRGTKTACAAQTGRRCWHAPPGFSARQPDAFPAWKGRRCPPRGCSSPAS